MANNQILDPPYDGFAEWHEHFFPPRGESEIEYEPQGNEIDSRDDITGAGRFDAVEDGQGRIFVWNVEKQEPVLVCGSREEASDHARRMATAYNPTAPGPITGNNGGQPTTPQP